MPISVGSARSMSLESSMLGVTSLLFARPCQTTLVERDDADKTRRVWKMPCCGGLAVSRPMARQRWKQSVRQPRSGFVFVLVVGAVVEKSCKAISIASAHFDPGLSGPCCCRCCCCRSYRSCTPNDRLTAIRYSSMVGCLDSTWFLCMAFAWLGIGMRSEASAHESNIVQRPQLGWRT